MREGGRVIKKGEMKERMGGRREKMNGGVGNEEER